MMIILSESVKNMACSNIYRWGVGALQIHEQPPASTNKIYYFIFKLQKSQLSLTAIKLQFVSLL